MDLEGKVIVISGGAGALGVAVCNHLASLRASVACLDVLDETAARACFGTFPPGVSYWKCDTRAPEQISTTLRAVTDQIGMPDVVCAHAGIVGVEKVQDYDLAAFDELVSINVRGSFVLAQCAAKLWLDAGKRGQVIFTSSWVHGVPWPEITPYAASKAAINALMRGFARELAASGIRANAIAPGIVAAGMALKAWNENKDYRDRASRAIPLGFLQPVESVANAFAFLCSDLSRYMTGSVLTVDGGCSLYPNT